jgi:phosphoglucomutase
MAIHPLAGQKATVAMLIDVTVLEKAYFNRLPDPANPSELVSFGTSGHRGSPLEGTFTETHILAITQAICDFRKKEGITGPLFMGKDTHAVSRPAEHSALEVLAANDVSVVIHRNDGFTPTPVISHAILTYNLGRTEGFADGIVVTPSHNPPADGGFKYNPPGGGPADTETTGWIQNRANDLLRQGTIGVRRVPYEKAFRAVSTHEQDLIMPYVLDLQRVIDLEAIRAAGVRIGVDPLGGASVAYWQPIAEHYGLDMTIVNPAVDPTFSFMSVDHDGKIRMDCSSPYAMAGLVSLKDRFEIAFGCDTDADRHGIVSPQAGLMNPNHYLAIAIWYLLGHRPAWPSSVAVGKTVVSSSLIDRVVRKLGRTLWEVPVGFKWFAPGLLNGKICFGGEESAGASFLRRDGSVWTTDKDGLIMGLLAAEIKACTGRDSGFLYDDLTEELGASHYVRIDTPASAGEKKALKTLNPEAVDAQLLAGDPIVAAITRAPGNDAPIDGLKVITERAWFAARPSGTEDIYKLYAESFESQEHLNTVVEEAKRLVSRTIAGR